MTAAGRSTDSSGNLFGQRGHYRYGETWYAASTTAKWQFTRYERDPETGLDYAFARYYNSRLGRFMSPDPVAGDVGDPQSLNRYAYVENDPTNFTEPLGLFKYACLNDDGICGWTGGPPVGLFFWVYDPFFSGTCTPEGCSSGGYYPVFWWPVQRGGGGGGGGQPKCTLNIALNNKASLGASQLAAAENQIAALFGSDVGVNFNPQGRPDYTLNVVNRKAGKQ